jgi:hypothetical protein
MSSNVPQKTSTVRSPNVAVTCLSLDREAKILLRQMATGKTLGSFVSALILAEVARREERKRLRDLLKNEI